MRVSVIIPAYNEQNRIGKSLEKIREYKKRTKLELEIVVVNDGSKDRTAEILKKYNDVIDIIEDYTAELGNMGKGYALRRGFKVASGDYFYICDADLSTPIEELERFAEKINDYDCVIGSRAMAESKVSTSLKRKLFSVLSRFTINLFLGLGVKDTQCGFKLMNRKCRDLFLKCEVNRWGYDFELLYLIKSAGLSIYEMPVEWEYNKDTRVTFASYFKTLKELLWVWKRYRAGI